MSSAGGGSPPAPVVVTTPKPTTTPAPKLSPDLQALKMKMMKSLIGKYMYIVVN